MSETTLRVPGERSNPRGILRSKNPIIPCCLDGLSTTYNPELTKPKSANQANEDLPMKLVDETSPTK